MNTPQAHILALFFTFFVPGAFANAAQVSDSLRPSQPANIQITLSKQAATAIRLEVKQAPLAQILKEITSKTGALIHYSMLSNEPITATCKGANVGQVMDCLVSKQISMISGKPEKNKPAEFWLVGNCDETCQAEVNKQFQRPEHAPEDQAKDDPFLQEQSDALLKQAQSKDPGERGLALYNLGLAGLKEEQGVAIFAKACFEDVLSKQAAKT